MGEEEVPPELDEATAEIEEVVPAPCTMVNSPDTSRIPVFCGI